VRAARALLHSGMYRRASAFAPEAEWKSQKSPVRGIYRRATSPRVRF
jgi:hypothetical protein